MNNIEYYCILIIDNLPSFAEQKNAIIFFFEEFILLLNPEMKDRLDYYKNICFDYMYTINSLPKEKEKISKKKPKIFTNYFFLMMVFIHIKIKYGDYNPVMLFNISKHFDCPKEIFMSYIGCLHENLTKKEIIDHFLLSKAYSNQNLNFNKNYICYNFYKLKQKNHSFIFNSGLNIIPQLKLHLIPEKDKQYINSIIEIIISQNIHFLEFLIEDYRIITSNQLKSVIYLLKSISKKCFIKYKEKCDDSKYKFISINKNIINDKVNILMNLYKLFKVLKVLNITLYECIKDNFFFIGEAISLFLDIQEKYEPIKSMAHEMDFIDNEMNKFIIAFYKSFKDKEKSKKLKLKLCDKRFFIIIWKYFYNKLQLFIYKDLILLEYNFMIEVISNIKNDDKFCYLENNETNDLIKIEFLSQIHDKSSKFKYKFNLNKVHSFFYKNRNKIMDLIVEKIPEKFIEVSNILTNYCKKYNFVYEVNILKKKNSKFLIQYLLNAFSILNSNERKEGFSYYKNFLIKNIINSVNNIQNINEEINLNESDIFIDKSQSIKLLNYSFKEEKMNNLIIKISDLYCEGKNDILFIEILKENITNKYVFNYLINSLSETQIKEIFQNHKSSIIKAIYRYTEINKYDFIQILLNNLKLSFPDDDFINNLIFPSDNEEKFNEMVNFLRNEGIIHQNIKKDYKNFFLFNYSLSYNACKNYEASAILYKYSSSSIQILNFCKAIYFSLKQIIDSRKSPNIFLKIFKYKSKYRKNPKIKKKKKRKNYSLKLLNFIQDSKNEAIIKELNPSYHEIYKLIELVSKKIFAQLDIINNFDCTIYLFYIIIFIFHKTPFKLKNMICKLELDNYSTFKFNDLIKNDVFEDESSISELELFIILSLLEIKGDTIISIKEYLPKFYSIIEEKYIKFREFEIPEINCRQSDDDKFIEGFKYILNNKSDILINNLFRTFNFYSFIFILELNNNTLNNDDINKEFYLERTIYRLLNFSNINYEDSSKIKIAENTFTLRDFTNKFLSLISQINDKEFELIFINCNNYLLKITSLCNFILQTIIHRSPYNLSLFNLKIFTENSDKWDELKNKILIQEIKNEILRRFDNLKLKNKEYFQQLFDADVRNWIDDYLKSDHIINEFSKIEKEESNFIKYIKYLKVNCIILNNFLNRIEFFIRNIKNIELGKYNIYKEKIAKFSINKKIKFTLIKEKDKEKARKDLEDSMYNYGKIISSYILKNSKYSNNNINIKISYYFSDEINDYVETCTNLKMSYFLNNKLFSCDSFFFQNDEISFKQNKNELTKIIQELKKKRIDFIIKLFFTFFDDINIDKNNEEFFEKYKYAISSYCILTALDSLEPKLQNFLYWIKMQFYKFFYQNIYPILYLNYRLFLYHYNIKLFDSKYNYRSRINPNIIVDLLNQNGYYIPRDDSLNQNLINFVEDIRSDLFNFEYINFLDLSEIFKSIRNTRFHDNDNLNSFFQVRAINYILNGDSLLNIFISDLFNYKSYPIKKIIVIDEKKINENLNTSETQISTKNDTNDNNINISSPQRTKIKGKKYKLKLDVRKLVLRKNNNEQIDLIKEKKGNNENNKLIINYNEKMKNFKFCGNPIIGYSGYIPYKDNFYGKSNEEIVNTIINNNFYLKYQGLKDTKKFEKVIIYNDEKPSNKRTNINKHHKNYFKFDNDEAYYEKRKKERKHFKVNDDYEIKKIIKFDYFGNYSNKKVKLCKRCKKNNEEYPNIFDSLFSIKKIGKTMEIIQHDIKKLLSPYNEIDKFELLMNHAFPNKTQKDIPENWKYFFKILNWDDINEDEIRDVGIIKLHKGY